MFQLHRLKRKCNSIAHFKMNLQSEKYFRVSLLSSLDAKIESTFYNEFNSTVRSTSDATDNLARQFILEHSVLLLWLPIPVGILLLTFHISQLQSTSPSRQSMNGSEDMDRITLDDFLRIITTYYYCFEI